MNTMNGNRMNGNWLHLLQNLGLQVFNTQWHKSFHVNKCVDVEHGKKSMDYRPLMNVINQCEENSPLMSMSAKVPKYILRSANRWVVFETLARSNDQGTLMYSHDCQWKNLSLTLTSLKVLIMTLVFIPDKVLLRSMGQDLLKCGP